MPKNNLEQDIKAVANDIAVNSGAKNTQDFIETNMRKSRSSNIARSVEGSRAIGDFTTKLLQLTLYQTFDNDYDMGPYGWIDKFPTKVINAGNSEQFSRALISGSDSYVESQFIPQALSFPQVDSVAYIKLYNSNTNGNADSDLSTLANTNNGCLGYKYLKPLTIIEDQWVPYFKSGKLTSWVADQINLFRKTYTFFRLNKIETMISKVIELANGGSADNPSTTGHPCRINGTQNNILDCFTKEVFPEIEKMRFFTNKYNLRLNGDANGINNSSKDELLMFVNQATYTKLTHGVLAQVFNNKLAELESILPKENIISVSKKVVASFPASTNAITMDAADLIADNQVLIISKNSIQHLQWLLKPGSIQMYDQNLARQFTFHAWGAYGFIPWGQCFLYQNDGLRNV